MAKQTVMWTALPNGVRSERGGSQKLRLSAFMSPRLESNVTPLWLASFPDFTSEDPAVNWASTVNAMSFRVEFRTKTRATISVPAAATRRTSLAQPDLWSRLFSPETPVKGYVKKDLSKVSVNSFAVKESAAALRDHISAIASQPAQVSRIPRPEDLISPPGFENSPLTQHLTTQMQTAGLRVAAAAAPAEGTPTLHSEFSTFHTPFVDNWNRLTPEQRLARNAAERETDFHKAITALGNYPALLPLLGIVVDFELTLTSALASQLRSAAFVRVVPTWPPPVAGVTRANAQGWTGCEVRGKTLGDGSYQVTSFGSKCHDGTLRDGYLVVRDASSDGANDPCVLQNVDIDLALGRVFASFDSMLQQIKSRVLPPVEEVALGMDAAGDSQAAAAAEACPV